MTSYHIGYISSPGFSREVRHLIDQRDKVEPKQLILPLERAATLFVPDVLDNMLIQCCKTIGIGATASKIVNSSADTMSSASNFLISQLIKKRSDEEVLSLVDFKQRIFLMEHIVSTKLDSTGIEITKAQYEEIKFVTAEIQNHRAKQVLPQLHRLMTEIADVLVEQFMKDPLSNLKLNFVLRKVADGTMATCKGAAHLVINRVFKNLNDEELMRLSHYFDGLILTAER